MAAGRVCKRKCVHVKQTFHVNVANRNANRKINIVGVCEPRYGYRWICFKTSSNKQSMSWILFIIYTIQYCSKIDGCWKLSKRTIIRPFVNAIWFDKLSPDCPVGYSNCWIHKLNSERDVTLLLNRWLHPYMSGIAYKEHAWLTYNKDSVPITAYFAALCVSAAVNTIFILY